MIGALFATYRVYFMIAAAGALLAGGAFVGYRVRDASAQRDVAQQLRGALRARDEAIAERDRALDIDTRIATGLQDLRGALDAHAQVLQTEIRRRPVTRREEYEKDGKTVVCDRRDPALYRLYFNAAVEGTAPTAPAPSVVPHPVPR